jgi:hypothetical protein
VEENVPHKIEFPDPSVILLRYTDPMWAKDPYLANEELVKSIPPEGEFSYIFSVKCRYVPIDFKPVALAEAFLRHPRLRHAALTGNWIVVKAMKLYVEKRLRMSFPILPSEEAALAYVLDPETVSVRPTR